MVRVFLCGPGGSGKTTLATELRKQKKLRKYEHIAEVARRIMYQNKWVRRDLENEANFLLLQEQILQLQCYEERHSGDFVISDRCLIDCLTYVLWRNPSTEIANVQLEKITTKFQKDVNGSVRRYQSSLMVVVHPWNRDGSVEDGTRIAMNFDESQRFLEKLKSLFQRFRIPYLELEETDLHERVRITDAAIEGKLPRPGCNLTHYAEASDRKNAQSNSKGPTQKCQTLIPFYLVAKSNLSIRTVKITEDSYVFLFTEQSGKVSRFVERYGTENLVLLEFGKKLRPVDVQRLLLGDIFINGQQYSFLGCSSSGMKARKAFLWRGDYKAAEAVLKECGDFDKISSVSKRMARIGLLFSSVYLTDIKIKNEDIVHEEDIVDGDYTFTDGCGGICSTLATAVYSLIPDSEKVKDVPGYVPTVFQFRLQGFKGVLALDKQIPEGKILVRLSMIKFQTESFPKIAVCGFSRPYTFGYLNRQLIYLLSGLGVPSENFLQIQQEHFHLFSTMHVDPEAAFATLQRDNRVRDVERIIQSSSRNPDPSLQNYLQKILNELKAAFLAKDTKIKGDGNEKEKLRILVFKSRFIYGVCDQSKRLQYGQCFLRLIINGRPKTITGKVVSGRMPCYLLGDIRVLEAVDIPELEHLVDCIVFPVQGRRPHADEQAGGDLDGDQFFVCWDERLVPPRIYPSCDYLAATTKTEGPVTMPKMLQYFSIQNEAMKVTGLLANLYNEWADIAGPACRQCESIGILFGRAIDATKSGETVSIPQHLMNPPRAAVDEPKFVWQKMELEAKKFKSELVRQELRQPCVAGTLTADYITESFVLEILEDEFTNLTEFQKFELCWRFSMKTQRNNFDDAIEYMNQKFLGNINFSLFSSQEKSMAIDMGAPATEIGNALNRSLILSKNDLEAFKMDSQISNWGLYYHAMRCDFDMYMLQRALTSHCCTQLFIKMPDKVALVFKFKQLLKIGQGFALEEQGFEAFFISPRFGIRKKLNTGEMFYYDLEEDRFQIYRNGQTADSLLWLRRSALNFSGPRKNLVNYLQQNEVADSLSIDLVKSKFAGRNHPRIRKTPLLAVEIFAQKDSVPAYPDILYGNYIDDIPEYADEEEDLDDGSENQENDRNVTLLRMLDEVPSTLSLPELRVKLIQLLAATAPWVEEPSADSLDFVGRLITATDYSSNSFADKISIITLLSRLNQQAMMDKLISEIRARTVSFHELLEVLSDWSITWYIPPNQLVPVVRCIVEHLWTDPSSTDVVKYLVTILWNCFVEFVNDITMCKEDISAGAIGSLRIDPAPEGGSVTSEANEVTLYRLVSGSRLPQVPSAGEFAVLIRRADWTRSSTTKAVACVGAVVQVTPVPFYVKLEFKDFVVPGIVKNDMKEPSKIWILNFFEKANITSFVRVIASCKRLVSEAPLSVNLANSIIKGYDETNGYFSVSSNEQKVLDGLNEGQRRAVIAALTNSVTLIHGPPGTGKTKVASSILQIMSRRIPGKILAVAETNNAVDNLCRRLLDLGVKILRIGNVKFVSSNLYSHTLEGKLKILSANEAVKVEARSSSGKVFRSKKLVKQLIDGAEVVLATCAGAGDSDILGREYAFVLVDEATQTKEHTLLCALSHKAEQLVLIGDPEQLGPLVNIETDWNWLNSTEKKQITDSLEKTLFHKLYTEGRVQVHMLDMQYRMHPDIARFPSEKFYEGKLKTGVYAEERMPPWWKALSSPSAFLHVDGRERKVGNSWANDDEAEKLEEIIRVLGKMSVSPDDIVILTLYSAQVSNLKRRLGKVLVSSIDGYQGREAPIILVSTVRSKGNLGFSDDPKRLNVLLTRAKRGFIVVGHRQTLSTCGIWNSWIQSAAVLERAGQLEQTGENASPPKNVKSRSGTRGDRKFQAR